MITMKTSNTMIDLMNIAQTEADGGDLEACLSKLYEQSDVKPEGQEDAVIWKGGNHGGGVSPVAHSLTDCYALLGTVAALDVLKVPSYLVPMWAQYRHDKDLAPLSWFGNMPYTSVKWSTAGDAYVNDGQGNKVVVKGKSGNAALRTKSGVFCNVRPYGTITVIRSMPCLPYSQDKSKFDVDPKTGVVHSEMNTPGIQMAYACRHFLKTVHETQKLGRVAFKPTQAQEDGINAGLLSWLLKGTKFTLGRTYTVDGYDEHKEKVDRIIALLPDNFKEGMENWSGQIEQHIADTNYGLLLWDLIQKQDVVVLSTDLDGDRLTDLLADVSDPLRHFGSRLLDHMNVDGDMQKIWYDMGYTTGNGRDMTSVMYRMHGPPIFEQTLGSADAMLKRLLDGDEWVGGKKKPYDPRIHYVLIRDAYKAANPDNKELHAFLNEAVEKFDEVYSGERPGFLQGYEALKKAIKPWQP